MLSQLSQMSILSLLYVHVCFQFLIVDSYLNPLKGTLMKANGTNIIY